MAKQRRNNGKQVGGCTGKGWQPGQSGNPDGRPTKHPISDALLALADGPIEVKVEGKQVKVSRLEALARVAWDKAIAGDVRWAKELIDRIQGRARESLDITSGGEPIAPREDEYYEWKSRRHQNGSKANGRSARKKRSVDS